MVANENEQQWYAVQVRTRFAKSATMAIREKGFETFHPVRPRVGQFGGRSRASDEPLFPGYVYCRLDPQKRLLPVLTTPGVISIVSAGKVLLPVPAHEIDAIEAVLRSGLPVDPCSTIVTGTRVFIHKGPLSGVEGVIAMVARSFRLIVSVELLCRSVMVEIDREWARPVQTALRPRLQPACGVLAHNAA